MRSDEVRYWRRLMRETMLALDDDCRAGGELLAAAGAARTARLPFPPYSWENPFALLVTETTAFSVMRGDERCIWRPRLAELFDRCLAAWPNVLETVPSRRNKLRAFKQSRPTWCYRKDCGHDG